MEEEKSLTNKNQTEKHKGKSGSGVDPSRAYGLPSRIDLPGFLCRMP